MGALATNEIAAGLAHHNGQHSAAMGADGGAPAGGIGEWVDERRPLQDCRWLLQ